MKVICNFAFNIMNIDVAKFSTYGNPRDQSQTDISDGATLLPFKARQKPAALLSLPSRQNAVDASVLQNAYSVLF